MVSSRRVEDDVVTNMTFLLTTTNGDFIIKTTLLLIIRQDSNKLTLVRDIRFIGLSWCWELDLGGHK